MSSHKKSSTASVLTKVGIGLAGVIGGLLLGKAIDEAIDPKSDKKK